MTSPSMQKATIRDGAPTQLDAAAAADPRSPPQSRDSAPIQIESRRPAGGLRAEISGLLLGTTPPRPRPGRPRGSRKWPRSEWHGRILRERYDSTPASITDLQRLFDVPRWVVTRWARELGLAKTRVGPWTPDRLLELEELLAHGTRDNVIARALGRTVNAVRLARKRHGLHSRRQHLMTLRAVAQAMGIPCAKSVAGWVRRGWLPARSGPLVGKGRERYVTLETLYDFIHTSEYWPTWRPERIRDARIKEWVRDLPRERYLRPGEVAARFHVGQASVNEWIHKGLLPAIRWGNWWVAESALIGFTPPYERSKKGMVLRRWTKEERLRLWTLRNDGATYAVIAAALGRSIGSISSACVRFDVQPQAVLEAAAS